jgi:hypothetical protein
VADSSEAPADKFLIVPADEDDWWWNLKIGAYPAIMMAIFWSK